MQRSGILRRMPGARRRGTTRSAATCRRRRSRTGRSSPGLPETLRAEVVGNVAVLPLARPAKRNALSDRTILGIEQFFQSLDAAVGDGCAPATWRSKTRRATSRPWAARGHVHPGCRDRLPHRGGAGRLRASGRGRMPRHRRARREVGRPATRRKEQLMRRFGPRAAATAAAAAVAMGVASAGVAHAAPVTGHLTGSLADGATWVADVPANWNGTLILYSHGYSVLAAQDAPNAATGQDLLAEGYALVGSSYSGPSMWALASAVDDQFASLHAVEHQIGQPRRTIAWGTSMGGLVSALETQDSRHEINGTLTTCGLVAGALNLNDYQLDGEYAVSHLLSPQPIQLVNYQNQGQADAAVAALNQVTADAQNTPEGRARIALAAALVNEPTWFNGPTAPDPHDYAAQEVEQEQTLVGPGWTRYAGARPQIELAAGGNTSATVGVDFAAALNSSAHAEEVRALYRAAGLDLTADLTSLTRDADIDADPQAVATLARTSMATGHLDVPELDIHTIYDQLVPVEQENWYGRQVARAGSAPLLRQAYVNGTGHCAFQSAEMIAALHAVELRIDTGRWDDVAQPAALDAAATALQLPDSSTPRYVDFTPPVLVGGLGEPGREHSY